MQQEENTDCVVASLVFYRKKCACVCVCVHVCVFNLLIMNAYQVATTCNDIYCSINTSDNYSTILREQGR